VPAHRGEVQRRVEDGVARSQAPTRAGEQPEQGGGPELRGKVNRRAPGHVARVGVCASRKQQRGGIDVGVLAGMVQWRHSCAVWRCVCADACAQQGRESTHLPVPSSNMQRGGAVRCAVARCDWRPSADLRSDAALSMSMELRGDWGWRARFGEKELQGAAPQRACVACRRSPRR
jgi:hypothetical protein